MPYVIYCEVKESYVHGYDAYYLLVSFCKSLCSAERYAIKSDADKVATKLYTRGFCSTPPQVLPVEADEDNNGDSIYDHS